MGFLDRLGKGIRQVQRAFHLTIALVFLVLAAGGALVSMSAWQAYRQEPSEGFWRFGLLAAFTVLLVLCFLYSLAKARSVR